MQTEAVPCRSLKRKELRELLKEYSFLERDSQFPEWKNFSDLLQNLPETFRVYLLGKAVDPKNEQDIPLIGLSVGTQDPRAPSLGLFAGVHGLERIGSRVALSYLKTLCEQSLWDKSLNRNLEQIRILFFPLINPIGIRLKTRSNGFGVDLMRNSPIQAESKPQALLGGQKFSSRLPWFQGYGHLETETLAVKTFFEQEMKQSSVSVTIDIHSGFGQQDQIWFPWAKSKTPYPHLSETFALVSLFEKANPHHFYKFEPQSKNYTTHGDLWDYLYHEKQESLRDSVYLPLTLELGSWLWVRKNPIQAFSALGPFNPLKPHREKRILRRHYTLFEFLMKSILSHEIWSQLSEPQKKSLEDLALQRWYS